MVYSKSFYTFKNESLLKAFIIQTLFYCKTVNAQNELVCTRIPHMHTCAVHEHNHFRMNELIKYVCTLAKHVKCDTKKNFILMYICYWDSENLSNNYL